MNRSKGISPSPEPLLDRLLSDDGVPLATKRMSPDAKE
jgi:hypothetical protein